MICSIKKWIVAPVILASAIVLVPPYLLYETNYRQNADVILNNNNNLLFDNKSDTTILVTGANSGLGFATVHHLARRAAAVAVQQEEGTVTTTIIMACRNMDKCKKAREEVLDEVVEEKSHTFLRLLPVPLDLADFESIPKLSSLLQQELSTTTTTTTTTTTVFPPIHLLILNAGIAGPAPELQYNVGGIESHYYVNHLGHALLTHHLWPFLKAVSAENEQRKKARIVTVSEGGALFPLDPLKGWYQEEEEEESNNKSNNVAPLLRRLYNMLLNIRQYARSKQAQLYFASELQSRYPHVITTSAAQPGYTRTPIYSTNFQGFPQWLKHFFTINPLGSMSPSQGALTLVLAALDETALYVGPKWFFSGPPVVVGRSASGGANLAEGSVHHRGFAHRKEQTKDLWDRTLKVLNIDRFGEATTHVSQ